MAIPDLLDEAYQQLHTKGPEFEGCLSNHGPMAADALMRLGQGEAVAGWVHGYVRRLEAMPQERWPISEADWPGLLGDTSRLGDWCALLARQVRDEPWDAVLTRWWPRLVPGAVASADHGLIRTGHAVLALREEATAPRLAELGHALGYWAARWQPVARPAPTRGIADVGVALDSLPARQLTGGIRTRLASLADDATWPAALGAVEPVTDPQAVPAALDALVDAAVTRYGRWGQAAAVMLVHSATAPRAVALVLPSLAEQLQPAAYETAWALTATIATIYRPSTPAVVADEAPATLDEVIERAVTSGDEHAIKFTRSPSSPTGAATHPHWPPPPAPCP